jgi:hypothetical protein
VNRLDQTVRFYAGSQLIDVGVREMRAAPGLDLGILKLQFPKFLIKNFLTSLLVLLLTSFFTSFFLTSKKTQIEIPNKMGS